MTDVLDQLRAAQPMPRGERLDTWQEPAPLRLSDAVMETPYNRTGEP